MTNPRAQAPVTIIPGDRGGGRLLVPVSRRDEIHALLDGHAVPYWDSPVEISMDGQPPFFGISLSVKADVKLVQQLLDSMP